MTDESSALEDFAGLARLFPLPNLVFFPQAVQPLHIFEPRYRAMTADALATDRLVALVLLRPDWEADYDRRPAVHPVACLGKIVADQQLEDGRYNLLLRGLARVRILDEVCDDNPYRTARVEVLADVLTAGVDELMALRRKVEETLLPRFVAGPVRDQVESLMRGEMPLGGVTDVLSFALPLPPASKQGILEELRVERRAERLIAAFEELAREQGPVQAARRAKKFPPDFSAN